MAARKRTRGRSEGQGSVLRRRRIGKLLRHYRNAAGLTSDQVGEVLECSDAKITRIETAQSPLYRRDLRDLLDLYKVSDEQRQEIMDLLQDADTPGWWEEYDEVLPKKYSTYIGFEADAAVIREYGPQVIPGLLQTEPYAREVIRKGLPGASADEIEARVVVRLERQKVLTRTTTPVRLSVVLDEAALHRRVGDSAAMREQLDHLIEAASWPNVRIRVHPFDAGVPAYQTGPFMLMEFRDPQDPRVCYIENGAGDIYLEKAPQIQRYSLLYEELCADALGHDETRELIRTLITRKT